MLSFSLIHWEKLREWWSSPLGEAFLSAEHSEMIKITPTLFGYHLLLLGEPQLMKCMEGSLITHRVWVNPYASVIKESSALVSRVDKLSILSDSVDVIYLAHCLEFINNPHEVLRETFRALIPEGHVIVSGFNPWSIWGIYGRLVRYIKRAPWDGRFISVTKLKDWLTLLGFDVVRLEYYFFRPPLPQPGFLRRLKWLETIGKFCWPFWGGGYVLVARKRVILLTAIKPAWQKKRRMVPISVAEPAARVK